MSGEKLTGARQERHELAAALHAHPRVVGLDQHARAIGEALGAVERAVALANEHRGALEAAPAQLCIDLLIVLQLLRERGVGSQGLARLLHRRRRPPRRRGARCAGVRQNRPNSEKWHSGLGLEFAFKSRPARTPARAPVRTLNDSATRW